MQNPVFRFLLAVLAGALASMVIVMSLELLGMVLFPLPEGINPFNEEQIRTALEEGKIPTGALVFVVTAWVCGAFAGSWLAARLALTGKMFAGWCIGTLIFLCSLMMLFELPHPLMMAIAALLLVPVASWWGTTIALPHENSQPQV
jgi:hypothetical protein